MTATGTLRRPNAVSAVLRTMAERIGLGIFTLFVVSVVIFSLMSLMPGDFAKAILGQSATPATIAAFQREVGLDRPPLERYINWISGVARGDFGHSFVSSGADKRQVAVIVAPRVKNTLFLAAMTAAIAVPLSILLGVVAAVRRDTAFDRGVNAVSLAMISMPEFLVAYVLLMFLSAKLHWLPGLSTVSADSDFLERVRRCALPALTLTLVIVAHIMRMSRAAILNVLTEPYIEMARFKGLSRTRIVIRHALPNAWAPIANVVAFNLAYLIVGVVIVEVVFAYPGIGQLMVDAVSTRDIPVVQACSILFAGVYIVLNLVVDLLTIVTNPRLLHPR